MFHVVEPNSNDAAPSSVVYAICIEILLYSDVELIELDDCQWALGQMAPPSLVSNGGGWGQPMGCCVIGNKKFTFVGLWLKDYIE